MKRKRTVLAIGLATCFAAAHLPVRRVMGENRQPEAGAVARLQEAGDLLIEGYYERAIEAYRPLLEEPEVGTDAACYLVECYLQTGQYDEAGAALKAAEGMTSARWHLLRGETASRRGDYAATVDSAQEAIRLDPRLARAHWLLGQTLESLGKRDDAIAAYAWFDGVMQRELPTEVENLTAVGQGFYRYSVLTQHPNLTQRTRHVLTQIYQMAYERVERRYWPARVAAADLLRTKHNLDDAEEDYKAALRINNYAADAHVGLGWLALENWDFETVERRAETALETNPAHVGALNLLAACRTVERRYQDAVEACDRALAVNPNDLEALARKAGALLVMNETSDATAVIRQAERVYPHSALLHAIVADALGGVRRFAEAEGHYLEAIACERSWSAPRTELGLMYMQWGLEDKARDVLEASFKLDPFNERTKNTLDLLDRLESFATIETEHFLVRYDPGDDTIVAKYFAEYLDEIYDYVCRDYNAKLDTKTIIEIFPAHREFAVRITGKPWIHTVGACTGRVIAMDAPRRDAGLQGPYNFANVLTHEFTHTVTLKVTNNRIAHWFTEGLAVSQENAPRSYPWMELLADAVRRGELFTLDSIDWGFMRPRRATDRQMAYAQSEWMCEYLIGRFGYDVIERMLAAYAEGKTQEAVFEDAVGVSTADFDKAFAAWARQEAQGWGFDLRPPEDVFTLQALTILRPEDANAHARLARAHWDDGNPERAMKVARESLKLDEKNALALEVLVLCLRDGRDQEKDERVRAVFDDQIVERGSQLLAIDPANRFALQALAEVRLRRKQLDQARPLLETLKQGWPIDPFAARGLAAVHLASGDLEAALPELLEVARTEEHDGQIALQIGEAYEDQQRLADARYWYERALHIEPLAVAPHTRLAGLFMRLNETAAAVREYEVLCALEPHEAAHFTHCALTHQKLGHAETACEYARKAIALDPESPAGQMLKGSTEPN